MSFERRSAFTSRRCRTKRCRARRCPATFGRASAHRRRGRGCAPDLVQPVDRNLHGRVDGQAGHSARRPPDEQRSPRVRGMVRHGTRARLRPGRRLLCDRAGRLDPVERVALPVDAPGAELLLRRKSGLPLPAPLRRVRLQLLHDAQPGRRAASAGVPALPGHRRRRFRPLPRHDGSVARAPGTVSVAQLVDVPPVRRLPPRDRARRLDPDRTGHRRIGQPATLVRLLANLAREERRSRLPGIRRAESMASPAACASTSRPGEARQSADGSADAAQPRCCATRPRPLRDMRWR